MNAQKLPYSFVLNTILDDNVREVQEVDLERVEHSLPGDNDLFGLFLYWEGPNKGRHFFGRFPLGQLTETFLPGPDRRVDNLEEELARACVKNENRPVDRFRRQVSFEGLVDSHTVHVRIVHEPNDLIGVWFVE